MAFACTKAMHVDALSLLVPSKAASDPLWQHQLGLLLESTGEGIFGIDLAGHCMFINRAGAHMLGYEPREVLGANMHALTHHSHADGSPYPDTDCPIFNAFRQGLPCRLDTEVFWRRDHSAFAVEYSSHPILDGAAVRGAVITFVDITERRRAAEALQKAKAELEIRVAERTRELSVALGQQRELAAYLEKVREDERTRIAREVHDELGGTLTMLKLGLATTVDGLALPASTQARFDRLLEQVDSALERIEEKLLNLGLREISSNRLGELVMRELKKLDKVAYVRFASVYRSFEDVDEFRQLIRDI